jgi:arginase family enzyme
VIITNKRIIMYTFADAPFDENGSAKIGLLGAPSDLGSTTAGGGQSEAPRSIRLSYAAPPLEDFIDLGDVIPTDRNNKTYLRDLAATVAEVMEQVDCLVVVGGDDSISYGVLAGVKKALGRQVNLVHFDAHDDQGERAPVDHANWVSEAKRSRLFRKGRQLGVRAPGSKALNDVFNDDSEIVIVLDMDSIDPSQAPGVSVAEPMGLQAQDVQARLEMLIRSMRVVAFVVTEVNPLRDINDMTSRLAFRLIYNFVNERK